MDEGKIHLIRTGNITPDNSTSEKKLIKTKDILIKRINKYYTLLNKQDNKKNLKAKINLNITLYDDDINNLEGLEKITNIKYYDLDTEELLVNKDKLNTNNYIKLNIKYIKKLV